MRIIFYSILMLSLKTTAQNLVPNSSFEDVREPLCGIHGNVGGELYSWESPTWATPVVYYTSIDEACYNHQPFSAYDGPIGIKGSQLPRTGEVMVGLRTYTIEGLNQRQYVQCALNEVLTAGEKYIVSFYVSLADNIEFASNNLGVYLSEEAPSSEDAVALDVEPQIVANEVIEDIDGWVLVRDTILITDEDIVHLTIGNFSNDEMTTLVENETASGEPGTYGAYYFIDDVSVELYEEMSSIVDEPGKAKQMNAHFDAIHDLLNVRLGDIQSSSVIHLYNAMGQMVYANEEEGSADFQIDMSGFAKGIYILKAETGNGVETVKIMK